LRRAHPFKRGIRVLGIAESFVPSVDRESLLAGVVMRKDRIIDGFAFAKTKVGGDDATRKIISLYCSLGRNDVNAIMLSGAVISFYNVVDLDRVHSETGLPLVCLTYRESTGLEESIRRHFPKSHKRKLGRYTRLGQRRGVELKTGKKIFVRAMGLDDEDLRQLLDAFSLEGKYPEPVRVAGLLAAAMRSTV
jgi:endonuclease V-like protein UPF0215 family